jgi:hypothetical protein
MADSVMATSSGQLDVSVVLGVDVDDPELGAYLELSDELVAEVQLVAAGNGFVSVLNALAAGALARGSDVLGAFGDDVLFRTPGWDLQLEATRATPGFAYGDDLIHGERHPSAVFASAAIVRALGWLALPAVRHQWADDAWKHLGRELGLLRYMPDVVLEHMHVAVDKAPWDDGYRAVLGGSPESNERARLDYEGFTRWRDEGLAIADELNVRRALRMPVWDPTLLPGGWVCGQDGCLAPVESEPCDVHGIGMEGPWS